MRLLVTALVYSLFVAQFSIAQTNASGEAMRDSVRQEMLKVDPDSVAAPTVNDSTKSESVGFIEELDFEEDENSLNEAITRNEDLLEKYPDDVFAPNVMFQLSELYIRKSRLEYRKAMIEYEKNYQLFDAGKITLEPILPRITFSNAISHCYTILEKYPKINFRANLLYRLGICHLDEGNLEKAREFFNQLIFESPENQFAMEAHFRLGEYYFSKRQFEKAIEHYQNLRNQWDNPFFNMALYKLGWTYYNLENYVDAIASFVYLLSDIRLLESANAKVLGKTKTDLRREAIDYIAICFSEYGGPRMAKTFLQKKGSEDYNLHVFLKLGEVYKKRNFYAEAIETYEVLLETYPFYQYAPKIRQYIIEAYEKDYNIDKAMDAREKLVKDYGPGSKWLNQYPEGKIRNDAIEESEKALLEFASYYHQKAQEKKRKREYLIAAEKYQDFLKKYPRSKQAAKVNYYLAECFFEIEDFTAAAEEYSKVIMQYGANEFQEDAAYNRIIAYDNIVKKNPKSDSLIFYLEDFLGNKEILPEPIKVSQKAEKEFLQACNDFMIMMPKSERIQEVTMKFAEALYNLNQFGLSASVYEKIITEHKDSPYYALAFSMVAQSYFKHGEYEKATNVCRQIQSLFPDSTALLEKTKKLIAFSGFKSAEKFETEKNPRAAADKFVLVAFNSTDDDIAKTAALRASAQYDSLGLKNKAVRVLESLPEKRPDFKFADELLYKAAYLREANAQWNLAIVNYMKLFDNFPQSKLAPKALYNVGMCYENMEKWELARSIYTRYVAVNFPNRDNDQLIEAMYKIGELYQKEQKPDLAEDAWNKTVRKFIDLKKSLESVDAYLPAKAQFMVAEIRFDEFKTIKIVEPFNKTVLALKHSFNNTLQAYSAAAKFNDAEWTTASLHQLGQTYEKMVELLLQIPISQELSKEELKKQQDKISEPLKKQAYMQYKKNVKIADTSQIDNKWVQDSRKRMQVLIIELGLGMGAKFGESMQDNTNESGSN